MHRKKAITQKHRTRLSCLHCVFGHGPTTNPWFGYHCSLWPIKLSNLQGTIVPDVRRNDRGEKTDEAQHWQF